MVLLNVVCIYDLSLITRLFFCLLLDILSQAGDCNVYMYLVGWVFKLWCIFECMRVVCGFGIWEKLRVETTERFLIHVGGERSGWVMFV